MHRMPSTHQACRAAAPDDKWVAPVGAPSARPPAPAGGEPEGAEDMIHRLVERLESHPLAADLSAVTAAPRARLDYALQNIAMRRALTAGDCSRVRDLQIATRGAARRILEEVLLLIGDVAVISHDLELQSYSYSLVRADGVENVVSTGSPSEIRHKPVMRHKMIRIQNLDKMCAELGQIRQERDLSERRAQIADTQFKDLQELCHRKEEEWRAEKSGMMSQVRDLEAELATMKGASGYVRLQATSSERVRSKHQEELILLERQHSQHLAKLHRKIESLEQEIVLSAAARMAAEEQVQASSQELVPLQVRMTRLEDSTNLPDKPLLCPPPLATSRDAAPERREWLVRADENERWASPSVAPIVHVRPHVHARTRELRGAHIEESEDEDLYKHESRDEAWARMREELRQASETTMSMAVSAAQTQPRSAAGRPSSSGRANQAMNAGGPGHVSTSRDGLVHGPGDIERIRALLRLLQRRIAVEKESLFSYDKEEKTFEQNVEIMQKNCLVWFGEFETLLQVASVEFSDGSMDETGDALEDGAALDLVRHDGQEVGVASSMLANERSVATVSV